MEYTHWSDMRRHYPSAKLETRPVRCPDGITRLITLTTWAWDVADMLYSEGYFLNRREYLEVPFRLVRARVEDDPDLDLTVALEQEISYWAEFNYKTYRQTWARQDVPARIVLGFRRAAR